MHGEMVILHEPKLVGLLYSNEVFCFGKRYPWIVPVSESCDNHKVRAEVI